MRDSFVFHFEYLDDVPDELQAQFAYGIINYARYGTVPELSDWRDVKVWNKIKDRIDKDSIKYERRIQNLKRPVKQDAEKSVDDKPKRTKFVKPTIEEVTAFIKEKGYKVDVQAFYSYYESNGWKVGKNPMKNWQMSVSSWNAREQRNTGNIYQAESNTDNYEDMF